MKEVRIISMCDLRKACIKYDWYTCGDTDEYSYLLSYANMLENITTDELETIATDIKIHSNTEHEVKDIMFILSNEYCITFITE